jgi:hypothetical protein
MKKIICALMLSAAAVSVPAFADEKAAAPAAEAAPAAMSTATTPIGDILDNPAAKAIVEKYLPGFSSHPQTDMIKDEIRAKIDADFAALATTKPA